MAGRSDRLKGQVTVLLQAASCLGGDGQLGRIGWRSARMSCVCVQASLTHQALVGRQVGIGGVELSPAWRVGKVVGALNLGVRERDW